MKKIVTIMMALLVGVNVYAVDVSDFDIKGIKLGMSKSEVLKKMPCNNPKIKTQYITSDKQYIYGYSIECLKPNISVIFDNNAKVHNIVLRINFKHSPRVSSIKNNIIKKYGQPTEKEGGGFKTFIYSSTDQRLYVNFFTDTNTIDSMSLALNDDSISNAKDSYSAHIIKKQKENEENMSF